jgi:2'-5' RNA ligase
VTTARLFVAVWPPPSVIDVVAALARPERPRLRWTTREHWHVTLRFLGTADVEAARGALAVGVYPSAVARLGPALIRLGRGVLAAPVSGLDRLAASVVAASEGLGRPAEPRRFTGHLTLARSRDRVPADLAGGSIEGSWPVSEITLVASHLHPHGARYEVLERYPVG